MDILNVYNVQVSSIQESLDLQKFPRRDAENKLVWWWWTWRTKTAIYIIKLCEVQMDFVLASPPLR